MRQSSWGGRYGGIHFSKYPKDGSLSTGCNLISSQALFLCKRGSSITRDLKKKRGGGKVELGMVRCLTLSLRLGHIPNGGETRDKCRWRKSKWCRKGGRGGEERWKRGTKRVGQRDRGQGEAVDPKPIPGAEIIKSRIEDIKCEETNVEMCLTEVSASPIASLDLVCGLEGGLCGGLPQVFGIGCEGVTSLAEGSTWTFESACWGCFPCFGNA